MNERKSYDVIIIGGGITGTAVLHVLSRYTNVGSIALIEKYGRVAQVNSNPSNNSQTLHFGDIETNYSLEKATKLKIAATAVVRYIEPRGGDLFRKTPKMVLAVGADEVEALEKRYEAFRNLFPRLKIIGRDEIAQIEPKIVEGRDPDQPILALLSEDGYAVDYQKLSESFLTDARQDREDLDVFFGTEVTALKKDGEVYLMETKQGVFWARVVVVASGPYSLLFAQSLGYREELGILPVAGSFYFADRVLAGKVYTMQMEKIPFAAVHGDPDVIRPNETRFGPTAKVLPLLERHKYKTIFDFLRTKSVSLSGLIALLSIMRDKTFFAFIAKNLLYDIPLIGKLLFLKSVKKIVPTMRYSQLHFGKGLGGIRPQVFNTETRELQMGEVTIVGKNIIFNTTPSPGASVCLRDAERDTQLVIEFLGEGYEFDHERFMGDLY